MFMEGIRDDNGLFVSMRVRSLIETEPQSRYSRMLSGGRFKEAEELAKLYDLDLKVRSLQTEYRHSCN